MLPRETSIRQLKTLRKLTKGKDIGDLTANDKLNKNLPNIQYIGNPVDNKIESWEEFSAKDSKLQTIAFKSKLANKSIKENSVNESLFSNKVEDLYNKLKKDPLTKHAKSVEINENSVQVEFEYKAGNEFQYMENDEIIKRLKSYCNNNKADFIKYEKFSDTGLRGVGALFSKDIPYVTVSVGASLRKAVSVLRNDGNGPMRANYDRMIFSFSETHTSNLHISEKDYLEKYGDEDLNKIGIYVLLTMNNANKKYEKIMNGNILKINEFLNVQDEKTEIIDLILDNTAEYTAEQLQNMTYDELNDIMDSLYDTEEESDPENIKSFESFKLNEPKTKKEKQPEYTMLGQEKELESNPNFGIGAVKAAEIKKITDFNLRDPKTPKERPVLNAGTFIDNDIVKGYVNRIDGKDVYVETLDNPLVIKKFSLKDVVKLKKENKEK